MTEAALRARIAVAVERLIEALDALDAPDEDLEPEGNDEPDEGEERSLGWTSTTDQTSRAWRAGLTDHTPDLEGEHDGSEPSIGSGDGYIDQRLWCYGGSDDDRERDEADTGEPDAGF